MSYTVAVFPQFIFVGYRRASRGSVPTLPEARARVLKMLPDDACAVFHSQANALTESGGTVGPLLDGTVIRVVPAPPATDQEETEDAEG